MLRNCKQIGLKISLCDGKNASPKNINLINFNSKKDAFQFLKGSFLTCVFEHVCVKKTFYTRSLLLNRKLLNLSFIRERNYIKEKTDSKKIESNHVYFISYLIKLCVYCIYNLLILHIIN